jgi:hypothetical protein
MSAAKENAKVCVKALTDPNDTATFISTFDTGSDMVGFFHGIKILLTR